MKQTKHPAWIRKKRIAFFIFVLVCLLAVFFLHLNPVLSILAGVLSLPFIYIVCVLIYSYYQFSECGGNYQSNIHDLIVSNISTRRGKLLDIGVGSGALIIKAVKALPGITATGIDSWDTDWDYCQKLCENNAHIECVDDRVAFIKGSASKLPFNDGEFDIVISCLTFHEVKDESNKTKVLQEAMRVLKHGGQFVFLDLFLDERIFESLEDLTRKLNVAQVETIKLDRVIKLPRLLLISKSLGNATIIKGFK